MSHSDIPKIEDLGAELSFWNAYRELQRAKRFDPDVILKEWAVEQEKCLTSPGPREEFAELCKDGCLPQALALLVALLRYSPTLETFWVEMVGNPDRRGKTARTLEKAAQTLESLFGGFVASENGGDREVLAKIGRLPVSNVVFELAETDAAIIPTATPDKRRGKSRSRRSGQSGYIERAGRFYYVRFRMDVPGQEKRKHCCIRLCPVSGAGAIKTKAARKRRAKELIAESGADSAELFNRVQAMNRGITFRQQSEWWINHVQTRKRRRVKPATAYSWRNCLDKWLIPALGDVPLADVNNLTVRALVSKMAAAGLAAKTIDTYIKTVKAVVASAVNENGEPTFPRKWNADFMDLPSVENQHKPKFTGEQVTSILKASSGQYRVLYALLAGTGLRIGEALALEVGKHVSSDCMTITVGQSLWNGRVQSPKSAYREIDIHPSLAALLREHIGDRTSGFIFQGRDGHAVVSQSSILKRSLHPILKAAGYTPAGFHAFRRFRVTRLRECKVPEDIIRFWIGHSSNNITDGYSGLSADVEFRRKLAPEVGLGFEIPVSEPANCTKMYETDPEAVTA